jgi:hypothetical protein
VQAAENPPNKLLLVENLPPTATADMLELICKQFLGLVEVCFIIRKGKKNLRCSKIAVAPPCPSHFARHIMRAF